jgi:ATP-dependent RNA helicase SUPV3L1/SUV3
MHITHYQFQRPIFQDLSTQLNSLEKELSERNNILYLRKPEEAMEVLIFLDYMSSLLREKIVEYPFLKSLFDMEFIDLEQFETRNYAVAAIFTLGSLFKQNNFYQLNIDGKFNAQLLESHKELFKNWIEDKIKLHEESMKQLSEPFDDSLIPSKLLCQCDHCVGVYRTKVREDLFNSQKELIEKNVDNLHEYILNEKINNVSSRVNDLKTRLDANIKNARFKLRKSTLNKLESEMKYLFKSEFGVGSDLFRVYKEKVIAYLNGALIEEKIKPEILSEDDYTRFLNNLSMDIWKPAGFIRKEFLRFINTLMSFKRKDISSTILKDYLGQFWLHSAARKKTRRVIYHMGPTNSGKTYHAIEALCKVKKGCYLAPLRLLASELFDTMNSKGVVTTLLTGEEVIEKPNATHYSSTIEMAKLHERFDCAVIDEIQMISDPHRGWAWTRALVNIDADEIHVCGDRTAHDLVEQILKLTGDTLEVVQYERKTQLMVESKMLEMSELRKGDAVIVFSRRNALRFKADLERLNFKVSIIYGMLSPEVRREQARKFDEGETDIIVSTDAIAMGMNLPVQRIVFSTFVKFVNSKELPLTFSEIKQIAGRAGRYLRFPIGYVSCLKEEKNKSGPHLLQEALAATLEMHERAMVGPDLEIYKSVNKALEDNNLKTLDLSEFLRLFYTMPFQKPFYCVQLNEMIEITEAVEAANAEVKSLSMNEIFGFACAPVNLGLMEHVEYFMSMVHKYVHGQPIKNELIKVEIEQIDYLENSIKCVELYQWLSRHFDGKNFDFNMGELTLNKIHAIEKLNDLLSEKTTRHMFRVNPFQSGFKRRDFRDKKDDQDGAPSGRGERGRRDERGGRSRDGRDSRDHRGKRTPQRSDKRSEHSHAHSKPEARSINKGDLSPESSSIKPFDSKVPNRASFKSRSKFLAKKAGAETKTVAKDESLASKFKKFR